MPSLTDQSEKVTEDFFSGENSYEIFDDGKQKIEVPYLLSIAQRKFIYSLMGSLNKAIEECKSKNISAQIELPIVIPEFLAYLQRNYKDSYAIEDIIKGMANPIRRVTLSFIERFEATLGNIKIFSQQANRLKATYNDTVKIDYPILLSSSKPLPEWKLIFSPTAVEKLKQAVNQYGKIPDLTHEDAIIPEEVSSTVSDNNNAVSNTSNYFINEFKQFGPITVLPEIGEFQTTCLNRLINQIERYSTTLFFVDEDFLTAIKDKYIEYPDTLTLYDSHFIEIIQNTAMQKKIEIEIMLRNTYENLKTELKDVLKDTEISSEQIGFDFKTPEVISGTHQGDWKLVANPTTKTLLNFLEQNNIKINVKPTDPIASSLLTKENFTNQSLAIFQSEKADKIIPIMINAIKEALKNYKANENLVINLMDETAIAFCKENNDGADIMLEMTQRSQIIRMMIGNILGGTLEVTKPAEKLGVVTIAPKKEPRWDTIVTKSNGEQEVLHKNTPAEERALQRQLEYGNNKWFLKGEIEHSLNIDEYVTKGYKLILYPPCAQKLIEALKESVLKEHAAPQKSVEHKPFVL